MKLKKIVEQALNKQINLELRAGYAYLSMAAYFDSVGLPGFSSWFRAHAQEENAHAMKIYEFIAQRNGHVVLDGIDRPKGDFSSAEDVFSTALKMEEEVTSQIHELFELSHESKEYGTQNMLHWFLDEQVKEEALFGHLLEQVQAAGDSRWHLMVLDRQMGGRSE